MTEYEKIELDLAIAAMDSDVSNDDLDLIFDGLTDKEIDKLQVKLRMKSLMKPIRGKYYERYLRKINNIRSKI